MKQENYTKVKDTNICSQKKKDQTKNCVVGLY